MKFTPFYNKEKKNNNVTPNDFSYEFIFLIVHFNVKILLLLLQ